MSAREWLYERLVGACIDPELASAELDVHRAESIGHAIAQLHAIPVTCTALTGPVWYGTGWNDCITALKDIADYRLPDNEAYPGELQRLRARMRELRAAALRNEDLPRVQQILTSHAEHEAKARAEKGASDFFQRGHTYTYEDHGDTIRFLVEYVSEAPDGSHRAAFGWRIRTWDVRWERFAAADMDGWTDTTSEATS